MGKPYSMDLRERAVAAVVKQGLSRHEAAARFGVGVSTVIRWVQRFLGTGSVAPSKIGGYRPKAIAGEHRAWLLKRIGEQHFTIRGLVAERGERDLKVDYRTVWNFVHAEKPSFKKSSSPANAIALTSPEGARSGGSTRIGSILPAWSLSTRPGPRPTGRRCGDGGRAAPG